MKTAYFSLGCFWSPQLEFEKINGVKRAEVGYCGGDDPNTTYEKFALDLQIMRKQLR